MGGIIAMVVNIVHKTDARLYLHYIIQSKSSHTKYRPKRI